MSLLNKMLLSFAILALSACAVGVGARVGANSADLYSEGTQLDDSIIERKAMARIKEAHPDTAQVVVSSHNRAVLLTGEVNNADTRSKIERIIYSVPNVKKITNELTIGSFANGASRRLDARITASIKSSLNSSHAIRAGVIRVVSDKSVVYLLGLVPHVEANAAAEVASKTEGVVKVVRAFEYID